MDTVEIVILLIALVFVIALFVIVYILIKYFKNQPQNNKHYSRKNKSLKIGSRLAQNSSINQLESKLLTMLQGDIATAKRYIILLKLTILLNQKNGAWKKQYLTLNAIAVISQQGKIVLY